MIVTVVTLIVLLISILFIKSTVIYGHGKPIRTAKVNIFICILAGVLAFVPFAKWVVVVCTPIIMCIWYATNGFVDDNSQYIELSSDTFIGKILLFKI